MEDSADASGCLDLISLQTAAACIGIAVQEQLTVP